MDNHVHNTEHLDTVKRGIIAYVSKQQIRAQDSELKRTTSYHQRREEKTLRFTSTAVCLE